MSGVSSSSSRTLPLPASLELGGFRGEDRLRALALAHQRIALRARDSLELFGRYVFGVAAAAHHRLLIEALEAVEREEIHRLLVIWPFGHAKSTWGSVIWPSWYLGRHPNHSLIEAATTGTLANLYQDAVGNVFESNERYALTFPEARPDKSRGWSQDGGLFLKRTGRAMDKDPSLSSAGAGGPVIGRRADGVIGDDLVDEPTARSGEVMLPARRIWTQRSLLSRLKPGGWAVVLGTIWAEDDVVMSLASSGEWVVYAAKALSETREQYAEVIVPDGVSWRPRGAQPITTEDAALLQLANAA